MSADFSFNLDEVGIAYGRFHELRLKSCYQPLFRLEGAHLVPFAVEALVVAYTGGQAVPARHLFGRAQRREREALERLCRVLHMRNYRNISVDGLELFFNADPSMEVADVEHLEWLLAENGIEPAMVVCEITEAAAAKDASVAALGEAMRRIGVRVAVDDFGAGHSTPDRVRMLRPDIVKIDGGFFQRTAADAEASSMLSPLFHKLRELGALVLVEGVETPAHLWTAIDAGADHLQGFLLGRPALAGTIFDDAPVAVTSFGPARKRSTGVGAT